MFSFLISLHIKKNVLAAKVLDGVCFVAQKRRNPSTGSLNELEGKPQSGQDATMKSGRELFNVFPQRVSMTISNI